MSSDNTAKKLWLGEYLARYDEHEQAELFR
jgi:hypothetical protein